MQVLSVHLEYWAGTQEYVFRDERGVRHVETGEANIRSFLAARFPEDGLDGWIMLAHAMGPAGITVHL